MKHNWSLFFKQYTILLVIGSLGIGGALMYIDSEDKTTANTNNLQEPKTITIKKTYKSNNIVNDYEDQNYNFDNGLNTTPQETAEVQVEKAQTTHYIEQKEERQPVSPPAIKTPITTANKTAITTANKTAITTANTHTTKLKKGLNARNPYAVGYANSIKEYVDLSKRAEQLKEEKKRATGKNRYELDNELRKMKPQEVNITNKLKSEQKKYRTWEENN